MPAFTASTNDRVQVERLELTKKKKRRNRNCQVSVCRVCAAAFVKGASVGISALKGPITVTALSNYSGPLVGGGRYLDTRSAARLQSVGNGFQCPLSPLAGVVQRGTTHCQQPSRFEEGTFALLICNAIREKLGRPNLDRRA